MSATTSVTGICATRSLTVFLRVALVDSPTRQLPAWQAAARATPVALRAPSVALASTGDRWSVTDVMALLGVTDVVALVS